MDVSAELLKQNFLKPTKQVRNLEDVTSKWEKSEAFHDLLGFICTMNDAVKGKKLRDPCFVSKMSEELLALLETLDKWVDEIPPFNQPQRYGNKAFRSWYEKVESLSEELLKNSLDERYHVALPEIATYFIESVGNSTRIDYGTGHEMSFVAFLCCLFKLNILTIEDAQAVVLKIFYRYLELMRKVQIIYKLEPAGSHGVWNLDDYQFVPFIWGSAQLINHPHLKPKSFLDEDICRSFEKDYMFFGCIQYINQVKTGPFAEHSNQLWSISDVPSWSKINQGLIKMYRAEVLLKFPVIQHFLFGSLLKLNPHVQI